MDSNPPASPVTTEQPAAPTPKQQIVERVRGSKNVLITVGTNPSVDELASALGFTFMLGKLDKHVTAVFSGAIPPAMSFLDPESTFENTIDSLRDFIIALDKEKADKLRYKVEEDVVKIFITPYKTVLKKDDFAFSQGDLNVDVVVALGVEKQEDLDKAITSHGRILHDAVVITINAGVSGSELGSINWTDPSASSVSEMLVSISEAFGGGLLDEQISTAFLTGIVAETNRFSNEKTSPKVMTMAAQLMAAGANQQLIATNLRQEGMISESVRKKETNTSGDNGEMVLDHKEKNKLNKDHRSQNQSNQQNHPKNQQRDKPRDNKRSEDTNKDGPRPNPPTPTEPSKPIAPPPPLPPPFEPPKPLAPPVEPPIPPVAPSAPPNQPPTPAAHISPAIIADPVHQAMDKPTFSGTLSATTSSAEEDKLEQAKRESGTNNVALEHHIDGAAASDAVEEARKAVEDAAGNESSAAAIGPQLEHPSISHSFIQADPVHGDAGNNVGMPPFEASTPGQTGPPNDTFVQPAPEPEPSFNQSASSSPIPNGLPPLPPLPNTPQEGMLPMPPLPGQSPAPSGNYQAQINPGFMQNMPQSQNQWTQAGEDLSTKEAEHQQKRDEKMDKMTEQYDQAVIKNEELRQQKKADDHSTFPLPQ